MIVQTKVIRLAQTEPHTQPYMLGVRAARLGFSRLSL
jgi:hypothetical protein